MDMIKIGNTYITAECIAAVSPDLHDEDMLRIFLTGGKSVYVKASMTEAEVALMDAGLIEPPYETIPAEDVELLRIYSDEGYTYVAKDRDRRVYVFETKPKKNGAYWEDGGDAERVRDSYFDWLSEDDDEPTLINKLFADLGVSLALEVDSL